VHTNCIVHLHFELVDFPILPVSCRFARALQLLARPAPQAIPLEELLFLHDPDGKYEGANFLIASNDDIYQEKMREAEAIEAKLRAEAEARAEVERLRLEEEAKLLIYVAHDYTARPWVPQGGSEEEIAAFAVRKNRPLLAHRIARRRRDFGITVEYADHEAVDKTVDLRKQIVNN
jgi:hypothetical protein